MDGLDVVLPDFAPGVMRGNDWSVTLHTTNCDVTLDSRNFGNAAEIQ